MRSTKLRLAVVAAAAASALTFGMPVAAQASPSVTTAPTTSAVTGDGSFGSFGGSSFGGSSFRHGSFRHNFHHFRNRHFFGHRFNQFGFGFSSPIFLNSGFSGFGGGFGFGFDECDFFSDLRTRLICEIVND